MKVCLVRHEVPGLPVEPGATELASDRFWRTYREYPPGYDHELIWNLHDSPGRDIAAHQAIAPYLDCDFAVFMSARVFFHRKDWLFRLMEARNIYGDTLYGIMASKEACPLLPDRKPNPHLRTCLFACHPHRLVGDRVDSTHAGFSFESGIGNLSKRFAAPVLVQWNGSFWLDDMDRAENGFRRGDQSSLLAHDRHSLAYDVASSDEKALLNNIANGL